MKRSHNQAERNSSRRAAAPQSKIQTGGGRVRPTSVSPTIALVHDLEEDGLAREIIDLSPAEYAALKQAGAAAGTDVLMFMANAALEKAARLGTAGQSTTVPVRLRRRSLPGNGVRLSIIEAKAGRVLLSTDFKRELLTLAEYAAEKDGVSLCQFLIEAINQKARRPELKASQGQGRTAA
jgi:uncharacterized protein (DUF1778 family)